MGLFNFKSKPNPQKVLIDKTLQEKKEFFNGFYVYSNRFLKELLVMEDYSQIGVIIEYFNKKDYKFLSLGNSKKSINTPKNINFLSELRNVELLILGIVNEDLNLNPLNSWTRLNKLNFNQEYKTTPDSKNWKDLEALSWIDTSKKSDNIFECEDLSSLSVSKFKSENLQKFKHLSDLEELFPNTCTSKTLEGIDNLMKLKKLNLLYFRNIKEIKSLPSSIKKLKLAIFPNLEFLCNFSNLKELWIDSCKTLKSMKSVIHLKNLLRVDIMGISIIEDGDLSPLSNVGKVRFFDYKHYSHDN